MAMSSHGILVGAYLPTFASSYALEALPNLGSGIMASPLATTTVHETSSIHLRASSHIPWYQIFH